MTRIKFTDLPDESTPHTAENMNKLNNLAIDTTIDGHDEEVVLVKSNNLFNKNTITPGKGVDVANGGLYNSSSTFATDFIDVTGINTIYFNKNIDYQNWGAFYNSNKEFISGAFSSTYTFQVPSNAKYFRTNFNNEDLDKVSITDRKNEIYANKEKYTDTLNIGTEPNNAGVWVEKSNNLINGLINGKEITNEKGDLGNNASWYATEWIEIKPNTTYTLSGVSSLLRAEVDKNFNATTGVVRGKTFTTAANSKYVRFNSQISGYSKPMLNEGSEELPYEPYITPNIKFNNNGLYETIANKNIYSDSEVFIGEWLGKPLYRKVIILQNYALTANETKYISYSSLGLNNTDFISKFEIIVSNSSHTTYRYGNQYDLISSSNLSYFWDDDKKNLLIRSNVSWNSPNLYMIVEYTKTTDA